ncbi:hypothetical protein S40293_10077 [Stachybotrys chartarum IBT 40293]|nr:hypothetical protein S40293_10077 [Stachybotrys chartarum IBT 40293]
MAASSQQPTYHIGHREETLKAFELRNASTCLGYLLPTLEALPSDFSLLDIGCGPGSITFDLARRFPQARIVGVDLGDEVIERNKANIAVFAPDSNVEFRTGDLLHPEAFLSPEEMGSFDVVHEHTTLICIPDSVAGLHALKRAAKQDGGIVACREADVASQVVWPPVPESAELQERIYAMNGLDTQMGRKLLSKALEAGFRRDQVTASASVLSNITASQRQLYAGSMIAMLADENSDYRKAAAKFGYTDEQGDEPFLKTVALCIDTYCPISDRPSFALLEDYWASHLGTGTLGGYQYVPAMSYPDALAAARRDEERAHANGTTSEDDEHGDHGSHVKKRQFMTPAGPEVTRELPLVVSGEPLNVTSSVAPDVWQLQYNGLFDFETNENGHSYYTVAIFLIASTLPALLSLPRLIPGVVKSQPWSDLQSTLINPPVFGQRHREPAAGSVGLVPTRGQALYVFVISLLNVIFLLGPFVHSHPQSIFSTRASQALSIIGNHAGSMTMGNAAAHRWLGYWCLLHTVLHSLMLFQYYAIYGNYAAELLPLALLFLVGYYYHIWFLYTYDWGYEIWMFVAAGIWATDLLVRLVRTVLRSYRTAKVRLAPGTDGECIRIDIEGTLLGEGVAYLSFPSLGWRLWESHPFSVAFNSDESEEDFASASHSPLAEGKEIQVAARPTSVSITIFFARGRAGMTDGGREGLAGIVVCGSPAMADEVRRKVTQLTRNGPPTKPYLLVDESFGW